MVREREFFWEEWEAWEGWEGWEGETHRRLWDKWDRWEQKKLLLVRQLNSLLYTNYLIIHHLHQSSLKTL